MLIGTALADNDMVKDCRNDFGRDGILKGKLLPECFFDHGQVHTGSLAVFFQLLQRNHLFLHICDLLIEAVVALLELLNRNCICNAEFQQLILLPL